MTDISCWVVKGSICCFNPDMLRLLIDKAAKIIPATRTMLATPAPTSPAMDCFCGASLDVSAPSVPDHPANPSTGEIELTKTLRLSSQLRFLV
nr:hypothetical protein Iba_chr02bCG25250 [Ipomoea batatas]